MEFSNETIDKSKPKYECEKCKYVTNKKYNWNKHIITGKHLENIVEKTIFECKDCNKTYKDKSGLWRHIKVCNAKNVKPDLFSISEFIKIASEQLEHSRKVIAQQEKMMASMQLVIDDSKKSSEAPR
jgi:hypothetical protein